MAKYKNKWLGLALAAAVAFNALLPFFAVYHAPANHDKSLASVFGEQILICTGDGFKWVKLADLQNGKENPSPHSDNKCPLCYIAHHSLTTLTPAPAAIASHDARNPAPAFAYHPFLISFLEASPLNVRAPPVSFIG